jgi:hypothetical protein
MGSYHGSPFAEVAIHHIKSQNMYKIHNLVFVRFSEELVKQFSLASKLSKLHLIGEFK